MPTHTHPHPRTPATRRVLRYLRFAIRNAPAPAAVMGVNRTVTASRQAAASGVRFSSYKGRDHLIVPVVALCGDIVITPMNCRGPELVPASVLESAPPASWNNRPVLTDHPNNGTESANSPETLSSMGFGNVFNTRVSGKKLLCDAWLDLATAETITESRYALDVIERAKTGKEIEVSIGCWVAMSQRSGTYNGQPYEYVWESFIPDHLAMLPAGTTGACSVAAGCGAPRELRAASVSVRPGEYRMSALCGECGGTCATGATGAAGATGGKLTGNTATRPTTGTGTGTGNRPGRPAKKGEVDFASMSERERERFLEAFAEEWFRSPQGRKAMSSGSDGALGPLLTQAAQAFKSN